MSDELTPAQVAMASLRDTVAKTIAEGRLDFYRKIVDELVATGEYDPADIAAAALRLATAGKKREKPIGRENPTTQPSPTAYEADSAGGVRLVMSVGREHGIRAGDVVGSIANEAGVAGGRIGPIDIEDEVTYVTVPGEMVETILEKTANAKFRGRKVGLRVAEPHEGPSAGRTRPRGTYERARDGRSGHQGPRKFDDRPPHRGAGGGDRPRSYDRDTARDRPPRAFDRGPRENRDERPRRPYERSEQPRHDRDQGGPPRRSFGGGRPGHDRPRTNDRPPRDRSSYGADRPHSGPRYGGGDRPDRGGSRFGGGDRPARPGGGRFGRPGGDRPRGGRPGGFSGGRPPRGGKGGRGR